VLGAELTVAALDAAGHMALDEAVLLGSGPDELVLRVYEWSGRDCTFGYSQPFSAARSACVERGMSDVSPVRRATGGGIVFHDGDLTFSLVFPWDRTCAPETIYKNIHRGVHSALKSAGVTTALWSPARRPLGAAAACFTRAEPMDLVVGDGDKILGGALRKKGTKGLYQGSLRLEEVACARQVVEAAVADGAAREFGRAPRTEISETWLEAGRGIEARYRSREWNERR
jgi:lipoate-protein ligase A